MVIGLAPVIFALVTWPIGDLTPMRSFLLITALPVAAAELFVIMVAFREGLAAWIQATPLPRPVTTAVIVWLAIGIVTSLWIAPADIAAIRWTLLWIVHLIFGFSVAFLFSRQLRASDLIICYIGGFVIYSAIYVAFVLTHWNKPIDWVHHIPGAVHIRHIAIYAAAVTGMSIATMATNPKRVMRILAFVVATVGFGIGLWTGARGMVLSVVGATLLAALLLPSMRTAKGLGAAALSLGIALFAVAWLPTPDAEMMGVARQVAATTERELTTGRLQIWANVIHAITRSPILGYGPGQMPVVAPFYGMGQPHNLFLQVLLDWGLIGLACVLIVTFFYLRRAIPTVRSKAAELAAPMMAMLSLLLLSMIDAAMFHVLPLSIFAACAGLIAAAWRGENVSR